MTFELRKLTEDKMVPFRQAIATGFGYDLDLEDDAGAERFGAVFDRERMYPVFDSNRIVGTGGDFELTVTVPGGAQVSMSGLTIITVQPTHTRQGILTAMMRRHIDRARDRGELLGGLWASEVQIYGRFGYGAAVRMRGIKYDARHAGRGRSEPGITVRLIDAEEANGILPDLFSEVQAARPGMFQRSETWWKYRLFYDPEKGRDGASAMRYAVAEADGEPVGYMSFRQKASWNHLADGEIRVREAIATTDAGYRSLWHFATNVDLFPIVKYWNIPIDDPIDLLLSNGRTVITEDLSDGLWMRLVDVPAALEARAYRGSGTIVIGVADAFADWNEGSFRLTIDEGVGRCEKVAAHPDVTMDVNTLGALYLGGVDAMGLARAGRIDGAAEAVRGVDELFRGALAPWCPEIF